MTRATGPASTSTSVVRLQRRCSNDATKVKFTPLSAKDRFEPLKTGDIDVLSRNTTWTLSRDVSYGNFAGVTYYDGQGFMVRKALKVNSALELNGASICTQTGTTTELNLADYFRANNMKYEVIAFGTADETIKAYESGRCDVFTTDVSQLYAEKLKLANANDHVILPEIISKEPLGPLVRHGDDQWFDVVKWTLYVMLNAEELGISSKNVDEALKSNQPEIRRLLGRRGQFRRAARPEQGLGRPHRQASRQLRRSVRAQCRNGLEARDQPRHQPALDQRRYPVRTAGTVSDCNRRGTPPIFRHEGLTRVSDRPEIRNRAGEQPRSRSLPEHAFGR